MPAARPGWRSASPASPRWSRRAARSARSGVVGLGAGHPEHAQRPVALELVDPPALAVDRPDDHVEEVVERLDDVVGRQDLGHGGRADDVDEHHAGVGVLAAQAGARARAPGMATAWPTCRPNRSWIWRRSRSPSTMRLNPACTSPTSPPSSTIRPDVEVVVAHAGQGVAQPVERLGQRSGHRHGGDEPGRQPDAATAWPAPSAGSRRRRGTAPAPSPAAARPSPTAQVSSSRSRMPGRAGPRGRARRSSTCGEQRPERPLDQQVARARRS